MVKRDNVCFNSWRNRRNSPRLSKFSRLGIPQRSSNAWDLCCFVIRQSHTSPAQVCRRSTIFRCSSPKRSILCNQCNDHRSSICGHPTSSFFHRGRSLVLGSLLEDSRGQWSCATRTSSWQKHHIQSQLRGERSHCRPTMNPTSFG